MMKEVVIQNGLIINIGPWDYQKTIVQTGVDPNDEPIYEEKALNPFPADAVIEHREMEFDPDRGWYEIGTEAPLSSEEEMRRTFTGLFVALIKKSIITIDDVPAYPQYNYKSEVSQKLSDSDA